MVNTDTEGVTECIGIGAKLQRQGSKSSGFILTSFVKGGTAESCGMLKEGDELLTVDKMDVRSISEDELERLLLGPEGSHVQLKVRRDGKYVYTICLERHRPVVVKQREVPKESRTSGDAPSVSMSERIYAGMAKINAVRYIMPEERLSPEELKEWRKKHDDQVARNEKIAQQLHDARLRRHAEIGVLQRELSDLVRQNAPYAKVLEYENWIKRLELEDEFGPDWVSNVDTLELQAVMEEAEERLSKLQDILELLLSSEGEGEEKRSEIAITRSKIRENEIMLARARKNLGMVDISVEEGKQPSHAASIGDTKGRERELAPEGTGEFAPQQQRKKFVSSEVAADIGNRWKSHEAEPREGIGVVAEGTIESAPEPCMLASTTQSTIANLFNVHIS